MDDFKLEDDDDSDLESDDSVDENIQTKIDKLKELNNKMQKGKMDNDDDDEEEEDSFDEAELEKQLLKKMADKNNSKANDNKKLLKSKTDSKNVIDKNSKTSQKPEGALTDGKYKPFSLFDRFSHYSQLEKIDFNPQMRRHIIH